MIPLLSVDETVVLLFSDIERVSGKLLSQWMNELPDFRRKKAQSYRKPVDQARCAVGFCLLAAYLDGVPDNLAANQYGKPYLDGRRTQFNLTHSGQYVAAAFSRLEIGVDIEEQAGVPRDALNYAFTPLEREWVLASPDPARAFARLWTLKESYIKALGYGMSFPPEKAVFYPRGEELFCEDDRFCFSEFPVANAHLSVCAAEPCRIRRIELEELIKAWNSVRRRRWA